MQNKRIRDLKFLFHLLCDSTQTRNTFYSCVLQKVNKSAPFFKSYFWCAPIWLVVFWKYHNRTGHLIQQKEPHQLSVASISVYTLTLSTVHLFKCHYCIIVWWWCCIRSIAEQQWETPKMSYQNSDGSWGIRCEGANQMWEACVCVWLINQSENTKGEWWEL